MIIDLLRRGDLHAVDRATAAGADLDACDFDFTHLVLQALAVGAKTVGVGRNAINGKIGSRAQSRQRQFPALSGAFAIGFGIMRDVGQRGGGRNHGRS